MKILILGVGAIGSNLARLLVPDLRGEHEITVLDMDTVEERNTTAGTQWFYPNEIGMSKAEAVQYNALVWFDRNIDYVTVTLGPNHNCISHPEPRDLVIDCFDNFEAREFVQQDWKTSGHYELLHVGFSDQFTFAIEWAENYQVPTTIKGMDICEMPGAAAFVNSVASLAALTVEEWVFNHKRLSFLGNKFSHTLIK